MKKRLLNAKHVADLRNSSEPPLLSRTPVLVPTVAIPHQMGATLEEEAGKANSRTSILPQDSDVSKFDKQGINPNRFGHSNSSFSSSGLPSTASQVNSIEVHLQLPYLFICMTSLLKKEQLPFYLIHLYLIRHVLDMIIRNLIYLLQVSLLVRLDL